MKRRSAIYSYAILFALSTFCLTFTFGHYQILSVDEIVDFAESGYYVLLISSDYFQRHGEEGFELETALEKLIPVLKNESVVLRFGDIESLLDDEYVHFKFTNANIKVRQDINVMIIHKKPVDRFCLFKPALLHFDLTATVYDGFEFLNMPKLIDFVNSVCDTYLDENGNLSAAGLKRNKLLANLFSVKQLQNGISMLDLVEKCGSNLTSFFYTGICENQQEAKNVQILPGCETIEIPDHVISSEDFFERALSRSKPVIFKNLINQWPAGTKWTNEFFRKNFGNLTVHIKLTSSAGIYEGVESVNLWDPGEFFKIPEEVKEKLDFPDLVLVRPAGVEMKMNEFIDIIEKGFSKNEIYSNVSAYIEYTHLKDYFKELEKDIGSFQFAQSLHLKHLNVWFSDGNTIGKLHFDEYDNFLCQLKGRKQVIMFEPHSNDQLYEGYIVEGELSFENGKFLRNNLKESVSLTMSPVNIVEPNFKKFPKLAFSYPLNCTIDEGDVLFMPSFWWHEVQSYPNYNEQRNLAVNFWYEPFFTKEFPCPECSLQINRLYRDI